MSRFVGVVRAARGGAPDFMEGGVLLKLPISLGRWKRGVWERYVLPLGSK